METLGCTRGRRMICLGVDIPFGNPSLPASRSEPARIDGCLVDENNIILMLMHVDSDDVFSTGLRRDIRRPALIAKAIAAYQWNNYNRSTRPFVPQLDEMTIHAVVLWRSTPIFYKITVTAALSATIGRGSQRPDVETVVACHKPVCTSNLGMQLVSDRDILLRYYQAFIALL